jgi:hypothetical protein
MKLIAAMGAACAALFGLWMFERSQHADTRTAMQAHESAAQAAAAQAQRNYREKEQELNRAAADHAQSTQALIVASRRALPAHTSDSGRLRIAASAAAASAGRANTPAASDIEAGPAGAGVLADLLGRAEGRATALAAIADEARIRGLACEADYDRAISALRY